MNMIFSANLPTATPQTASDTKAPIYNIQIINNGGNVMIGDGNTMQTTIHNVFNSTSPQQHQRQHGGQDGGRRDRERTPEQNPDLREADEDDSAVNAATPPDLNSRENRKRKQGTRQLLIPFRQRKRKALDLKTIQTRLSSGGVSRELIFSSCTKDTVSKKSLDKLYHVMSELHPLRESGNWDEFNQKVRYHDSHGDPEVVILTLIERSVALSYMGDFEDSQMTIDSALTMLANTNLPTYSFLITLIHCHLTSFYRRQNMLEESARAIAIAEQNLRFLSKCLATAFVFYEKASNLTKAVSLMPLSDAGRAKDVLQAKEALKQCIDVCTELDDGSVYIRRHHFALPKLALLDLNCRTRAARSERVSGDSIQEAKCCIEALGKRYGKEISQATSIQLNVAQSDLYYRRGEFSKAKQYGHQALEIAERLDFKLEVKPIQERLDDIKLIMNALSAQEHLGDILPSPTLSSVHQSFAIDVDWLTELFRQMSLGLKNEG